MSMKTRALTEFEDPYIKVKGSSYGVISHQEWCEKEMNRINRKGGKIDVRIVTDARGYIALSR